MKRLVLVMIVAVLVAGTFATIQSPAKAAPAQQGIMTAQVLASQLYVRTRGSLNAGILSVVNWGDRLIVLGRSRLANWAKIIAPDGTVGWVSIFWIRLQYNVAYASLPIVS